MREIVHNAFLHANAQTGERTDFCEVLHVFLRPSATNHPAEPGHRCLMREDAELRLSAESWLEANVDRLVGMIVDRASRWIEAFPMVTNTAEHLLAAFLLFIWRRGCPKILYSDRGVNLLSFLAYKGYQRLGVTKASGSSHHLRPAGYG